MDELAPPSSNIPEYSVSELSGAVKRTIEGAFGRVRVRGEITECRPYSAGHIYLSLKDEGGKVAAVIWKSTLPRLKLYPENGVEVIATGRLTTYGERSSYQLVIDRLEYAGEGALLARIELLRRRLIGEGLFDAMRKRVRPLLPVVVGVVTSESGAVLRDIVTTIARRFPRRVLVWPVPVQGVDAAARVAAAITGFGRLAPLGVVPRPDVLIVARGGGSLEDLMAFNDEAVVRAAAASAIPLISAVGHETDTTLIDHAADIRAPTPTAAAELAVPERHVLAAGLLQLAARLAGASGQTLQRDRLLLEQTSRRLPDLPALLATSRQRLDDRTHRLELAWPNLLSSWRAALLRALRGMPNLPGLLDAARHRMFDRLHRLDLPLPNLMAARQVALERAGRMLTNLPRLLEVSRQVLADREHRLKLALPNLVAARRSALVAAEQRVPDLLGLTRHARQDYSGVAARLPAAVPALMGRRRDGLALAAAQLRSAVRHAVATKAATAAKVLPRLSPSLPQALLREGRARLEGVSARLESISHHAVLARGYAVVFDGTGHPVTAAAGVRAGAALRIGFADGEVAVKVAKADIRQATLL